MLERLKGVRLWEVPPVELVMLGLLMGVGLVAVVVLGLLLLEQPVLVLGELAPWHAFATAPI